MRTAAERWQWVYAIMVAVLGLGALAFAHGPPAWPSSGTALVWGAGFVFVILAGFPAPYIGNLSLSRTVQVAALLVLGTAPAAWIAAFAGGFATVILFSSRGAPLAWAVRRSLNNAGMFALMLVVAGATLEALRPQGAIVSIAAMLLVMQTVNELLFGLASWVEGGEFRRSYKLWSTLLELVAGVLGVLTASVYGHSPGWTFWLYLTFLIGIVLAVRALALVHARLERQVGALRAVNGVAQAVSTVRFIDDIAEQVHAECVKVFRCQTFYFVLYDAARGELEYRLHHDAGGRQPRKRRRSGEGAIGWVIERGEPLLIEDWATSGHPATRRVHLVGAVPVAVVAVPLRYRGEVLGALCLESDVPQAFSADDRDLLMTMGDQVAVAVANARLFETVERESKQDPLTGLANRRHFDARLDEELARARRFGRPLTLALADLDHFKGINDRHSHLAGDEVLRQAADLLRSNCRGIDLIGRYGGEEFGLLLPETGLAGARAVCEKIRVAFESHPWRAIAPDLRVTISIGAFELTPHMDAIGLLESADLRLYEAKRAGRNRVVA